MRTVGHRAYPADGELPANGAYWKRADGWHGISPSGNFCNLTRHQVTEHEDGTITVAPSIEIEQGAGNVVWHGYLERGIWRQIP